MRLTCRPLLLAFLALALTAATPDTFTREELKALEAERRAAEQKLEALQTAGETTLTDLKNIDAQLISAAMESQRREEQASKAEKTLIDLGARRVAAQMRLLENRQALEDLLAALAASNRRRPTRVARGCCSTRGALAPGAVHALRLGMLTPEEQKLVQAAS